MFRNLGIHWASSVPAFLALACVPFPFLFYKHGAAIRRRSKFAREAEDAVLKIREKPGVEKADPVVEAQEEEGLREMGGDLEKGRR